MGEMTQGWARSVGRVAVVGGLVAAGYAGYVGLQPTQTRAQQGVRVGRQQAMAPACANGGTQIRLAIPDPGFAIKADPAQALTVGSMSYGVSNPQMATSGSLGKPQVSSVNVLMTWFPQESRLFTLLTTGQRLTQVALLFTTTQGGAPTVCRSITLSNVAVSSLQESMASGSSATVSISFDFTKIMQTSGNTGAKSGGSSTTYDLTTNKATTQDTPTPVPTP